MNVPTSLLPAPDVTTARRYTFADVAMRIAHDGPVYAILGLAAVALATHNASVMEAGIVSLGGLLARSFPPSVRGVATGAGLVFVLFRLVEPAIAMAAQ
jgi:hypothetical protein